MYERVYLSGSRWLTPSALDEGQQWLFQREVICLNLGLYTHTDPAAEFKEPVSKCCYEGSLRVQEIKKEIKKRKRNIRKSRLEKIYSFVAENL